MRGGGQVFSSQIICPVTGLETRLYERVRISVAVNQNHIGNQGRHIDKPTKHGKLSETVQGSLLERLLEREA